MRSRIRIFLKMLSARWRLGVVTLLAVLALGMIFPGTAFGATGSLYAQPLTFPAGGIWLNGALGGHLWVADHALGFCRLDGTPTRVVNQATCSVGPKAVGQPAFDATRNLVYVPDLSSKSLGVWRFPFNPATETLGTGTVIASNAVLGIFRPKAVVLNANGSFLFMSFDRTGNVTRINAPAIGTTQGIQTIGHSSDGGSITSLAVLGSSNTLHLAEATGVTVMPSTCISGCVATPHPTITSALIGAPLSLTADKVAGMLYIGDATSVFRFNTHTLAVDVYAQASTSGTPYSNVSGLAIRPATATIPAQLFVLDDPSAGAVLLSGRAWVVALNQAPIGSASASPPPPSSGPALTKGTLLASALTLPSGGVWMGTHLWIADHALGLCRLDGTAVIQATCAVGPKAVGQPAFDATHNVVYVPDLSSKSLGVWRFPFDPATETLGTGTVIAASAGLGVLRPTGLALASGGGSLYVTFDRSGGIARISGPASGTSQSAPLVGVSSDGGGVAKLAMLGTDLYLAEAAAVTTITNVSGCSGGCTASAVSEMAAITAPLSLAADSTGGRIYIGDATGIFRFTVASGALDVYANTSTTGTAFSNVSGLVFQPATATTPAALIGLDDPSAGELLFSGHAWQMAVLP